MEQSKDAIELQTPVDPSSQSEQTPQDQGTQPTENSEKPEDSQELPPMTYIDFIPQCLGGPPIEGKEPDFADFGSAIEQANQWLLSMPQFSVYKCETINVKMSQDYSMDNDNTLMHTSSNGRNVYLRILRMWLIPKADTTMPVQQISYITVLPDHQGGDLETFLSSLAGAAAARSVGEVGFPSFDNLKKTVDKLNKHLQVKPLPGRILTVETLSFKCQETNTTDKLSTEASIWSEGGANGRVFLNGLRIFYVVGQPAFESIDVHDEEPDMFQNSDGLGLRVKFASFSQMMNKAAKWLQKQQAIRVVNIQTVNIKLDRKFGTGPWILDSSSAGFTENQSLMESRYSKVLRIVYVKDQKLESPSPYSAVNLTTKIFVPKRIEGKRFESFSKTMLRVIKWLSATSAPLFACETVRYHVSTEGPGQGFSEERPDKLINTYHGQHYITCIRLYFSDTFQEPPPDVPDAEEAGWGWGCVVS